MSTDDTRAGEVAAEERVSTEEGRALAKHARHWHYRSDLYCDNDATDWLAAHDARVRAADAAEIERLRAERQAIDVQHDLLGSELEEWQGMAAQAREDRDEFEHQRDRLAIEAETQHRLRVEAEQDARDADRERDRVVAGVRELAEAAIRECAEGGRSVALVAECKLRALLAPADDGEVHDRLCKRQWANQIGVDHCDCATRRPSADDGEVG